MSLWKNPAVVGPVVAALIAAVVAAIALITESDRSPPTKPLITEISRLASEVTRFVVTYEDVRDEVDGSGLKEVRLWYRHSEKMEWTRTEWANTATKGEIYFDEPTVSGTYFFDLVAADQAGNETAKPSGRSDGQKRYLFQPRAQDKNPSFVPQTQRKEVEESISGVEPPDGWVHVPVHFHLIAENDQPLVDKTVIHQQVLALNEAFFDGKISFSVTGVDTITNAHWHSLEGSGVISEKEMKESLARTPDTLLNVYVTNLQRGLLAWSAFPWQLSSQRDMDGCVVSYQTFPGGVAPFDQGKALVHCVGHWLGLYHTFQDGCDGPGDYVKDTPAHKLPKFGSTSANNACAEGQLAPVHNYMNYGDDSMRREFTLGQYSRMRKMIVAYRPRLL